VSEPAGGAPSTASRRGGKGRRSTHHPQSNGAAERLSGRRARANTQLTCSLSLTHTAVTTILTKGLADHSVLSQIVWQWEVTVGLHCTHGGQLGAAKQALSARQEARA